MALYYPGEMIANRYRVERELGEGGFGSVYEATELGVDRRVAVKVLKHDDGRGYQASTKARFEREGRAVGQLRSPHTVRLLDFGESEGKLYMAFELVPGEDLRAVIDQRGSLDPSDAIHILRQLLDSLGEAHRAGILHRDIKPANIRVFPHGDNPMFVKLLDFGLARPTDDGSPGITLTGEVVGTPRYMSPEQLSAQPLAPASDIYSLGIVFLEMLIGAAPLQGNRWADQFNRVMAGHVFDFPEFEHIDVDHVSVIRRMTALAPARRYQEAHAVLRALTSKTRVVDTETRGVPLVLPIVVLLVVLAVGVFWLVARPDESPVDAQKILVSQQSATEQEQPLSPLLPRPDVGPPPPDLAFEPTNDAVGSAGCEVHNDEWKDLPVYLPNDHAPGVPLPLIVFMPRDVAEVALAQMVLGGRTAAEALRKHRHESLGDTALLDLANKHGLLVLVPPGTHKWNADDNLQLVEDSVNQVKSALCVDTSRVFVIGDFESGGLVLDLTDATWVTAAAVYAWLPEPWRLKNWQEHTSKPAIWLTPTRSARIPTTGGKNCFGEEYPTLRGWERTWQRHNRCEPEPEVVRVSDGASCQRWACEQPFWSCEIDGGYHWPGGTRVLRKAEDCPLDEPPSHHQIEETILRFFSEVPPLQR